MSYPSFSVGDVLTAADMNAIGLWLVKTQTIGSAVSSVTVSSAFTDDFENYLITINGGVSSTTNTIQMTLGSTSTGYYYGGKARTYAGADVNTEGSNAAYWYAAEGSTNSLTGYIYLSGPKLAKNTLFWSNIDTARTDGYHLTVGGYLANTTTYTAFTLTPNTGTLTGGIIRVYGYRN